MTASRDIRCLLPEILARIFLMSIPDPAHPSINQSPLNVYHTSRLWRDIALSSPLLWSQLCLDGTTMNHIPLGKGSDWFGLACLYIMEKWEKALKTWIQRSGNTTLHIEIDYRTVFMGRPHPSPTTKQLFREMVSLMMKELPRWGDVTIDCRDAATELDIRFASMMALRSLTTYGSAVRGKSANLEVDLTTSSHIQRLSLIGARSIEVGETHFNFLTELRLHLGTYSGSDKCLDMCIHTLQQAPNLIVLDLTSSPDGHHRTQSRTDFIVLTHLKELRINFVSSFHKEILRWLILPALKGMEMVSYQHIPDNGCDQVVFDLLHRSHPPLERLKLYNCFEDGQVLIDALQLLPSLQKLNLCGHLSRDFLRELAIDGPGGSCPQLRELGLSDDRWTASRVELLINILLSRTRRVGMFIAHLHGLLDEQFDDILVDERVQSCMANGLNLSR